MATKRNNNEAVEQESQDFAKLLTEIDYGNVNLKLGKKMGELIRAVNDVGKSGSLTVTLHVKKEGNVAVVAAECKSKVPEHPMNGSIFYFGEDGSTLHREDPRQLKLKNLDAPKLKTVEFPTADKKGE